MSENWKVFWITTFFIGMSFVGAVIQTSIDWSRYGL
jgi:hypothetical protein